MSTQFNKLTGTLQQSNRYGYNDGYHTSHHLNPRRHWREHPAAFIKQKKTYAHESALVFHNIDYIMITVYLLRKDYAHLARCLVPIGDQIHMSLEETAMMLRSKTRRFTEEEIVKKFRKNRCRWLRIFILSNICNILCSLYRHGIDYSNLILVLK